VKGTEASIMAVEQRLPHDRASVYKEGSTVFFAIAYWILRRLIGTIRFLERRTNELEVLVLRHQLAVLRRQTSRPRLKRRGRLVMAALSRILPRKRWSAFLVTPQTRSFAGTAS
jgi:hypothetical protein